MEPQTSIGANSHAIPMIPAAIAGCKDPQVPRRTGFISTRVIRSHEQAPSARSNDPELGRRCGYRSEIRRVEVDAKGIKSFVTRVQYWLLTPAFSYKEMTLGFIPNIRPRCIAHEL